MPSFALPLLLTSAAWLLAEPAAPPSPVPPAAEKPASARENAKPAEVQAVATEVGGTVKFRLDAKAAWQPLVKGTPLPVGAEVLAGPDAKARIQMGPSVTITLKPFSRITIAQLSMAGDANTLRANLAKQYGRLEFDVRDVGFKNDVRISSPTGVMAVRGTGGEHINYGLELWVEGVKTNKDHAIQVQELIRAYQAFLSANEAWSSQLPTVDEFAKWAAEIEPMPLSTWFTQEANRGRGGADAVTEFNQLVQQFGAAENNGGGRVAGQ